MDVLIYCQRDYFYQTIKGTIKEILNVINKRTYWFNIFGKQYGIDFNIQYFFH